MERVTSDQVTALPGTCIMCPRSVRPEFIDTGIQIEWFGAVILCNYCVVQMGQMFGMLTQEQVDELKLAIVERDNTIFELRKQLSGLENIRLGLALAGYVVPDNPSDESVPSGRSEAPDSRPSSGQILLDLGTGKAPEQVHDEGLAELRPDDRSDASILDI